MTAEGKNEVERGSDHADAYREATVDVDDGTAVQVEEYPGGDMTVYKSGGEMLYLNSGQAAALRSCLGRIDSSKRRSPNRDSQEVQNGE